MPKAIKPPQPAPTAPGPRPSPVWPIDESPSIERKLEDALRRLVAAAPVDIVGTSGLTIEKLKEYVEARAAARDLLDQVAFGR